MGRKYNLTALATSRGALISHREAPSRGAGPLRADAMGWTWNRVPRNQKHEAYNKY